MYWWCAGCFHGEHMKKSITLSLLGFLPLLFSLPAHAATLLDATFTSGAEGFTVENAPAPAGPWVVGGGTWSALGGEGNVTSILKTPVIAITTTGEVTLSFSHRYSLEPEWDGGVVRISVNGGAPTLLGLSAFTANGYTFMDSLGNFSIDEYENVPIFNGDSTGYSNNEFITSTASLGTLSAGNTLQVQWVGLWDDAFINPGINWEITGVTVTQVPEASVSSILLLAGACAATRRRRRTA